MAAGKEDSGQEKSFEASDQKKGKAREKGDIPYSPEMTTFLMFAGWWIGILLLAPLVVRRVGVQLWRMLENPEAIAFHLLENSDSNAVATLTFHISGPVLALLLVPILFLGFSVVLQQAFSITSSKIKPKLSKISPISNAKKKYGPAGLAEFAKAAAKLGVILGGIVYTHFTFFDQLIASPGRPAADIFDIIRREAILVIGIVVVTYALISILDVPIRRSFHVRKLRMTPQEVKDENKENEGDPHQKRARMAQAQSIAMNTMLRDTKVADVVIVNPSHYAVALKWDRGAENIPVCVAKGVDEMAARIRQAADKAGVPIRSDPPCARSLYSLVEIGAPIQPEHYAAVAAAIYFAQSVRKH